MHAVLSFLTMLAIIALLVSVLLLLTKHAHIRRRRLIELHAPLLKCVNNVTTLHRFFPCIKFLPLCCTFFSSNDRRLDAALRDAEEGFNVCSVCSFENFKRFTFCTICGEVIVKDAAQEDKMWLMRLPLLKRKNKTQLTIAASPRRTTSRQYRAQRRKEWTRKLDVEGHAFWFRDHQWTDKRFAAFVVRFQSTEAFTSLGANAPSEMSKTRASGSFAGDASLPPSASVSLDARDDGTSIAVSTSEVNVDTTNSSISARESLVGSIEGCIAKLIQGLQKKRMKLVATSEATVDASKLPLDIDIEPGTITMLRSSYCRAPSTAVFTTRLSETMTFAKKDFPSKYAHFVIAASRLLVPAEKEHLRLNVERANVFQDSMESIAVIPAVNLHSVLRINFVDENGVDAGGLHREWFVMLNEMLIDPVRGLFVCTNRSEQTYFLSPCSNDDLLPYQLMHLYAAGRLLGRALLEGSMLCFHLALPLLKLILGYPTSFEDLEELDPEVYINLLWLLENDNVDALGLDFTVTIKDGNNYRDFELVPGGASIPVTDSNKREYVERKWKYMLVECIAPQLQIFLRGLYEIVPRELLMLFDPEEFDFLLCGSDEIDVDDWERNTKYSEVLHNHLSLVWFWELVREMPNEYRRRLLQFSTGSSRVPLGGFGALTSYDGRLCPFTLTGVSLVGHGFIHSHACFNRLDLPLHVVRDELKVVLYAMLETEVYGFTTE